MMAQQQFEYIPKQEILDLLLTGIVHLRYENKKGEIRDRKVTLHESVISKYVFKKTKEELKPEAEDRITVWDVDKDSWRSLKLKNVMFVTNIVAL